MAILAVALTSLAGCVSLESDVDPDEGLIDVTDTECDLYYSDLNPNDELGPELCFGTLATTTVASNGDIIRAGINVSNMYMYYIHDGNRFTFPWLTYRSWYGDDACIGCNGALSMEWELISEVMLAGNVTVRPGRWIIKIEADDTKFVVDRCGYVRAATDEVLEDIYGEEFEGMVKTVPEMILVDFFLGSEVTSASDYNLEAALAQTLEDELNCQFPPTR